MYIPLNGVNGGNCWKWAKKQYGIEPILLKRAKERRLAMV